MKLDGSVSQSTGIQCHVDFGIQAIIQLLSSGQRNMVSLRSRPCGAFKASYHATQNKNKKEFLINDMTKYRV